MKSRLVVRFCLVLCMGSLTAVPGTSVAQFDPDDTYWTDVSFQTEGVNGKVRAMTVYDGKLIVGGNFTRVGDKDIDAIAAWDGYKWSSVGPDAISGDVFALHVYNNKLYVGGDFYYGSPDGEKENILAWDGSAWDFLGRIHDTVLAMTTYNGEMYVAGAFVTTGGLNTARHVIRYDGSRWARLNSELNGTARALAVYDGALMIGGDFTEGAGGLRSLNCMVRWNGSVFSKVGTGMYHVSQRMVNALAVHDGRLFAGGQFTSAGGGFASNIAAWDGSNWSALGPGLTSPVSAFTIYDDQLVAGGEFSRAGVTPVGHIATWNGSYWSAFGAGVGNDVYALTVHRNYLCAGGKFVHAEGKPANRIARWGGGYWTALETGISGPVYDLISLNDDVVATGDFWRVADIRTNKSARFDGSSWSTMPGMINQPGAVCVYDGVLYAGGVFPIGTTVGNPVYSMMSWSGSRWNAVSPAMGVFPSALNWPILTMLDYGDRMIVGGSFVHLGAPYIISWNGSWAPLSGGVTNSTVTALARYGTNLIAAGAFGAAGATLVEQIASWNGAEWSALGSGLNGISYALTEYRGQLVAGGWFSEAGGKPANYIAAWDGDEWTALGDGMDSTVYALAVYGSLLIAGGAFDSAGGLPASHIAAWDGAMWSTLGSGCDGAVNALLTHDTSLYVGGRFINAGDKNSSYLARWEKWPGDITGVDASDDVVLPIGFSLEQNYPNPFNPATRIDFEMPTRSRVSLTVHNVLGQEVASLWNTDLGAGRHTFTWDGTDASGRSVATGIYFYRLRASGFVDTRKMLLLK